MLFAKIVEILSGWTLQEFSRGVLVNFFSTLVMSGGGKLLSKLKGSKDEEEQLKACLFTAISKHVKNKDIARYMREHDEEKYLDALKAELLSSEHAFSDGSDDAKILSTLQKELAKKPFFTLHLVHLYGKEICESSQEILDKLNEQIREIQKIRQQGQQIMAAVQTLTAQSGYTLNITDSMSGDFECPIPDLHFSRSSLVSEVKDKLSTAGSVYLYGGFKCGKSVLSCMVAQCFDDYAKVRLPLDYKNILSIKEIVRSYDTSDKLLFIIDGIPYQDEAVILDLCHFILKQDSSRWLFLLNGRQALTQYTTEDTGIAEICVPALSKEEISEIIPPQSQALSAAITALSEGSPMIAVLMIQMLQREGWPSTVPALYSLFGFSATATYNDKFRSIIKQIVPNRDAVRLLNRLLLIRAPFTREQSRALANVEPSITLPDSCFDDLNNVAITCKGDGEYVVTPSFAKTLTPDLLQRERNNCNQWLANQILSHKTLNELDVVKAMNYMLDGGDYDRAGFFYISCVTSACKQNAGYRLLDGIWIDLPLPAEMNLNIKILIRIQQIILFCDPLQANQKTYPAGDLENLLQLPDIEPNLLHFSYQVLYYYYGIRGDVERSSKYIEAASTIPTNPAFSLFNSETLWMTLFKVRTTSDLFSWFDLYASKGYPAYDYKEEMSNKAVSNIYTAYRTSDAENQLKDIIQRAEKDAEHLWPFIVSAEANLMFWYGGQQRYDDAENIYNNSAYQNEEFGKLLLNYSMGVCYYNQGRFSDAEPYFSKVTEVQNIGLNAINVLYSYVYDAAILSESTPADAVSVLKQLSSHSQFDKLFVESERVLLYGELAIAHWNNGERYEAVESMLKVENYLWNERNNMSDSDKTLLVKLSVLTSTYYGEMKGLAVNPENAHPKPALFILTSSQLINEYSDFRVLAVSIYLYSLQKNYLWEKGFSTKLLDHSLEQYKGSVINTHPEYATLFINCIPELLTSNRFEDVTYIISQSSRAVRNFSGVITHPENSVLVGSLFYVLIYRLDRQIKGELFEESSLASILSDFIAVTPNDCSFATYLLDVIEGREKLDINYSKDAGHQSLLLFLGLYENTSVTQWFVALQRAFISLKAMNDSKTCGQFLEIFSSDLFDYAVKTFANYLYQDQYQKIVVKMQKYTLFERARAVMSGFYYLMKNPPRLSKEVEEMIDMN